MKIESSPVRQRPFLAVYCLIYQQQNLLIQQRFNTGYADGFWSVPAGHVDNGESITAAASRELKEETGLIVKQGDWSTKHVLHRATPKRHVIDVFLKANCWSGRLQNREPDKCSALRFAPADKLPDPMLCYVERVIVQLNGDSGISGATVSETGW